MGHNLERLKLKNINLNLAESLILTYTVGLPTVQLHIIIHCLTLTDKRKKLVTVESNESLS